MLRGEVTHPLGDPGIVALGPGAGQALAGVDDLHADIASKQLTEIAVGGYRNFQSMIALSGRLGLFFRSNILAFRHNLAF